MPLVSKNGYMVSTFSVLDSNRNLADIEHDPDGVVMERVALVTFI